MLPIDKQAHILAGAAIASTLVAYGAVAGVAFGVAVFFGVAKELWDMTGRGTPDRWDAFWTVVGAMVVLPLLLL